MKKLLGILVLGLLLASCSEYNLKKALENCADQRFVQIKNRYNHFSGITDSLKNNKDFTEYTNTAVSAYLAVEELSAKEIKESKNFTKNNPLPKVPTLADVTLEGLTTTFLEREKHRKKVYSKYYDKKYKWEKAYKKSLQPLRQKLKEEQEKLKSANYVIKRMKQKIADEKFKKMNLNDKSKMNYYVAEYGVCEKQYNELPKKFLLKYEK